MCVRPDDSSPVTNGNIETNKYESIIIHKKERKQKKSQRPVNETKNKRDKQKIR